MLSSVFGQSLKSEPLVLFLCSSLLSGPLPCTLSTTCSQNPIPICSTRWLLGSARLLLQRRRLRRSPQAVSWVHHMTPFSQVELCSVVNVWKPLYRFHSVFSLFQAERTTLVLVSSSCSEADVLVNWFFQFPVPFLGSRSVCCRLWVLAYLQIALFSL